MVNRTRTAEVPRDKEEKHKSSSRDRSSTDREKPGDMGPPLDTSQREVIFPVLFLLGRENLPF